MNKPLWHDGWLMVPYDGPELAVIEISAGRAWQDAYRDWAPDGTRVVQIRAPEDAARGPVAVRVNGTVTASWRGGARPGIPHRGVT